MIPPPNAPMHIALVSQEYPPETAGGGIGTQTYLKAHGLTRLGHHVHVISRSTDGQLHEYMDGRVQVRRIPGFDARTPIYTEVADWITYSAGTAAAVAALHAQNSLDLVDFPEWAGEAYIHLVNRTEWNWIPTVLHLHGPLVLFAHEMGWPPLDSEFYRTGTQIEGTCLRLADALFSSSRYSAEWSIRHYQLPANDIPVLHTGVDTNVFKARSANKSDRPTIIFVGKLVENKGVSELAEAAGELAKEIPGLRLKYVGRGDERLVAKLRRTADQAGSAACLEFEGFCPHEELPRHLSAAHVFAAPAPHEPGPGLVYLEAMACELPVVACAGSGTAEVVQDGVTGTLVPPNDRPALVAALRNLLYDDTKRATIGRAARDYVLREGSADKCLQRLEAFYHSVIQTARPPWS